MAEPNYIVEMQIEYVSSRMFNGFELNLICCSVNLNAYLCFYSFEKTNTFEKIILFCSHFVERRTSHNRVNNCSLCSMVSSFKE